MPLGLVELSEKNNTIVYDECLERYEYTIYTSCCDLRNGIYYYTTYNNRQISGVNMFNEDLDGETLISYPTIEEEMVHMQN